MAAQRVAGEPAQVVVPADPGYSFLIFGAELPERRSCRQLSAWLSGGTSYGNYRAIFCLAALCPSWGDQLRLLDGRPGAVRHPPGRPSAARSWADYGYCAAHSGWSWA